MKIPNSMTADEAVKLIESGNRVLIQGGSATPQALIKAMVARAPELKNVEVVERSQIIINNQRITVSEQYKPQFLEFINKNSLNM